MPTGVRLASLLDFTSERGGVRSFADTGTRVDVPIVGRAAVATPPRGKLYRRLMARSGTQPR